MLTDISSLNKLQRHRQYHHILISLFQNYNYFRGFHNNTTILSWYQHLNATKSISVTTQGTTDHKCYYPPPQLVIHHKSDHHPVHLHLMLPPISLHSASLRCMFFPLCQISETIPESSNWKYNPKEYCNDPNLGIILSTGSRISLKPTAWYQLFHVICQRSTTNHTKKTQAHQQ